MKYLVQYLKKPDQVVVSNYRVEASSEAEAIERCKQECETHFVIAAKQEHDAGRSKSRPRRCQ